MKTIKRLWILFLILVIAGAVIYAVRYTYNLLNEPKILKEIIKRLESDTRIAEVLVTSVDKDNEEGITKTTIKFLEYNVQGLPLPARYFTFQGNVIQFQSLVVRFDDMHVRGGDALRGKSAYLFWKVFMLQGEKTEEYTITPINSIPDGYKIANATTPVEEKIWQRFWEYALNPEKAKRVGIKNAQIEAPGMVFVPGTLYTLKIEHDGGIRIDAEPLPRILRGEKIL